MIQMEYMNFAAIEIGSGEVSMKIYEVSSKKGIVTIDYIKKPHRIGLETYKSRHISKTSIENICEILNDYKRIMKEYDVKEYANGYAYTNYPKIVLSDGSIYEIQQDDCGSYYDSCVTDEYGNCKKDDNGNVIPTVGYSDVCGYIKVDVNGAKAPNQFGWDIFWLKVYKDKIIINNLTILQNLLIMLQCLKDNKETKNEK